MDLVFRLLLIAAGLLATSNLILAKRPDSKKLFDAVAPFNGLIGLVLLVISVLYLLKYVVPYLVDLMKSMNGWIAIATVVVAILLGFLLGFALLSKLLAGKSPAALEKGEKFRAKIAMAQIPLGIAGIALGIWSMI